jgi:exonuclease III
VEDIARLRRRILASGIPPKASDRNLLIGTWNIKAFGAVSQIWEEMDQEPRRNLHALALIAEVARHFDVLAIQEVKSDLSGIQQLAGWLGSDWGMIYTDVCVGDEGNTERLAFLFDRRRVTPSGLAGEIVLPPNADGNPAVQFSRTPFMAGFCAGEDEFVLMTVHIKYGKVPLDRIDEIRQLSAYIAREIRKRARANRGQETNLIVLGDFNIDKRGNNPLFQAFISTGLQVPPELEKLQTAFGTEAKYYDQIAWFMGDLTLEYRTGGVIDFAGAVMPKLTLRQMAYRVSDHFPLWAEFQIDHSEAKMAVTLGLDPGMPDPLSTVPDL